MPADARLVIANKYLAVVAPDMRHRIPPADKLAAGKHLIREAHWYRNGRGFHGELGIPGQYTTTGQAVFIEFALSQPAAIQHEVTRQGRRGSNMIIIRRRRTGKLPMPVIRFELV